jgi:hypothetical protein
VIDVFDHLKADDGIEVRVGKRKAVSVVMTEFQAVAPVLVESLPYRLSGDLNTSIFTYPMANRCCAISLAKSDLKHFGPFGNELSYQQVWISVQEILDVIFNRVDWVSRTALART